MKTIYSVDNNTNTLCVTCSGIFDFKEVKSIIFDVFEKSKEKNCQFVIIDGLNIQEGNYPTHQRFYLGEAIAKQWWWRLKSVFLYPKEWITKLGEMVANNRGANIFVTHDIVEAKKWLYSEGN